MIWLVRTENYFGERRGIFTWLLGALLALGVGLQSRAAQPVTLAWNANTETNLAGYRLYYGTATRGYSANVVVGNATTTATVTNLQANVTYFFAVTAFCVDGLESDYSDEVFYRVPGSGTNTAPIAIAASVSASEDQPVGITLAGSDANGDVLAYTVVTAPANGGLSGSAPNFTYTPNANFFGSDSLSFRVSDGQANSANATVSITVSPINDAPTLATIADRTISEDTAAQSVSLTGIGSGSANESQTLTVTATSSNPALIPNPSVAYASPGATGSLNFTPVANANGTATITVTVNDGQAVNNTVSRTFLITVNAVNDAPTLAAVGNISLALNAPAQSVNLTGIGTGAANESQTLNVTAASSNTGLIPNPTVSYSSPNATGSLSFTPMTSASGTATITVTVNDGQAQNNTAVRTFTVSVAAGNQAPTLATIANRTIAEDAGAQTVNLTGIGTGSASESQTLTVTATSSDPELIPNPSVAYSSPNATGNLGFTPVANANGTATITVTVNDGQALNNTVSRTFLVTVNAVNDAPTLAALSNLSLNEDAGAQAVSLMGIGTGATEESQTLVVTATSSNNGLIPNPGVTYTSPNTTGSLSFTPRPNASGTATITVTVNDGQAQNNTVSRTFTVTVGGINDTPTLAALSDLVVNEDVGMQTVSLSGIGAGATGESQTLSVTATSSNPALVPNPSVTYASPNATGSLNFTPVANGNGTATITVTVNDGQAVNNTVSRTFLITVNAVNDAPTLAAIGNVSLPLNAPAETVILTGIGTGANESQTLVVTATSSNTGLIPNPTVSYSSPNATGSLSFTPVTSASGSATITVTVNDGQAQNNTAVRTFTVSVAAGNQTPTLAIIVDRTIAEDAGAQTVSLTGIGTGSASESQTLTVTATSSDPELIPNPSVAYSSPNATGNLSFTPVANANGTATITVTVNDGQALNNTVSRTFLVTVNAVNDAPTLAALSNLSINEDSGVQAVNLMGIGTGAADENQTLVVTAASSNTGLIPNPSVTYTSPNTTGSLSFTPMPNASGTATITVTVNDGQAQNNTVSRTFTVTVGGINDTPTLAALSDLVVNEDVGVQTVSLSGIGAGATGESQSLTVIATSSNPALVPNPSVTYASPNATGSLNFTPVANGNGTATITVTVNDGQAVNNTVSRTFLITVNAVNDAPTLAAIGNVSLPLNAPAETVILTGIGTGANESQTLVVTATSSNTGIIPNPTVSYSSPNATGSLSFTPVTSASGSATITVTVNDGQAQNNTAVRTFTVSVAAGNQAPTLDTIVDRTVAEDAGAQTVSLTGIGTGSASESQTLTVTATSSDPALIPNPSVSYSSPNATGNLSFTPVANANGTATITVTVNDGQALNNTVSRTFLVTVNAVNDAPTLAALSNLSINEDSGVQAVDLMGIGTGAADENQTLVVTAASSNTGLIPNPSVTYTSPNTTGSLSFTPMPNASGTATITVTVNDGQAQNNTVSRTFTVTVGGINDTPTLAALSDLVVNEDVGVQTVSLSGIGAGAIGESQSLTVTATSSNPALIPNPSVSYASPNATGSLNFTTVANGNGTATITVTVNDGQAVNNTVSRTFLITVNAVNDAPTLAAIGNVSLPLNAPAETVILTGIGTGANESQTLVVTATSSNTGIIPNPTVSYSSPNATGSLSFTPVTSASGSATITVTVNDGQAQNNTAVRTFTVSVAAGNQAPTINLLTDVVMNEDAQQLLVNISGLSAGGAGEIQPLAVTVISSNPELIPTPTVRYDSPASGGYMTFKPVPGAYGTAEIAVTVDDGQPLNNTTTRTFQVTVNPVNDPPTLGFISDVEYYEDTGSHVVQLTGIGLGATNEDQILTITAISSNPSIIPNPVVDYTSPSATGTLIVSPVTNGVGSATITVTVYDGGGTQNSFVRTFYVAVRGINDPPITSEIADQLIDANGSSGPIPFYVDDPDTSLINVRLMVTSSDAVLLPVSGLTLGGSGADRTLTITPATDHSGRAQVFLASTDGYVTNTQTIQVTVGTMNQAPVVSPIGDQAIDASTTLANVPFQVSDAETAPTALLITATSFNKTVVPDSGIVIGGSGNARTLTVTPASGKIGAVTIAVAVSDGSRQTQTSFQLTVRTVKSRLTVNTRGRGQVSPDLNGQTLTVGEVYTMTATPETGQVFDSWSGDVAAASPTLTFVMRLNMVIDANFEADPYWVAQGTYNGLFAEAAVNGLFGEGAGVQHERSGNFTFKSTSRGSYSGKFQVGRGKYAIKGLLGRDGRATNVVIRPGLNTLTVELAVNLDVPGQIAGRVTDGLWTALLQGDRQVYNTKTNPAPFAGKYTIAVPPDAGNTSGPQGHGYGAVKIDGNGLATFIGMLADGTKATQKVPLSQDGHWPFYLSLYKGSGSALGWMNLDQTEGQIDGLVSWIKPAMLSKYCAGGFTNESTAVGSAYVAPSVEEVHGGGARHTEIQCVGGNLAEVVTGDLMVLPNGKLVTQGDGRVKFGLAPTTGLFKGTVLDPATGKPRPFSGVMLQKWNVGAGLILGLDEVGQVDVSQQ